MKAFDFVDIHIPALPDVTAQSPSSKSTFTTQVQDVLNVIETTLIAKNAKYGNSALSPIRVFSKAPASEQILVRLDDKLSRIRTQHISEDEDVLLDLIGYLVLLRISLDASK